MNVSTKSVSNCPSVRRAIRALTLGCLMTTSLALATGCSSPDLSGPTSIDAAQLPWVLALNTHAITLSTDTSNNGQYSTLQLTAVPQTIDGTLLADAPAPTFTSSDSSLRVSSTGLLVARAARNGVKVVATLVYRGVRILDTATVNITTATPSVIQQLLFQVQSGDSTIPPPNLLANQIYYSSSKTLSVEARDASGVQIPGSVVALTLSDPLQASLARNRPVVRTTVAAPAKTVNVFTKDQSRPVVPFTVYAEATVYGLTMRTSMQLTVTRPLFFVYTFAKTTLPGSTAPIYTVTPLEQPVVGTGAWIWWFNTMPDEAVDVIFEDPSAASPDNAAFYSGGGDIAPFLGGSISSPDPTPFIASRQFLTPGTFRWHSPRTGISGTILVQ